MPRRTKIHPDAFKGPYPGSDPYNDPSIEPTPIPDYGGGGPAGNYANIDLGQYGGSNTHQMPGLPSDFDAVYRAGFDPDSYRYDAGGGPAAQANYPAPGTGTYPSSDRSIWDRAGTFFADRWLDQVPAGRLVDWLFDPRGNRINAAANQLYNFGEGEYDWQQSADPGGRGTVGPADVATVGPEPSYIVPPAEQNVSITPLEAAESDRYGRGHGPASRIGQQNGQSMWGSAFPGSILQQVLSRSGFSGDRGYATNPITGAALRMYETSGLSGAYPRAPASHEI